MTLRVEDQEVFKVIYSDDWYDDPLFDGGRSLEMVDIANFCGEDNNWTVSTSNEGGTPGKQNAVSASNPDLNGPLLVEAFAIDNRTVKLNFNERVLLGSNPAFSSNPALQLNNPTLVDQRGSQLQVTSVDDIMTRTTYEISVTGVSDCIGNTSLANTVSFVLAEEGTVDDLILNEVLFDPLSGGADFVEIYNNSEKFINLSGWAFANDDFDENGTVRIITTNDLIIAPDEFLVFTEDKTVTLNDYPSALSDQVVEIDDLPTLPDSEGTIILVAPDGTEVERFDYSDDFHSNLLDSDEGVSLERIDVTSAANDPDNWKSAASSAGFATPGARNSQVLLNNAPNSTVAISPKVFVPDGSGGTSNQSFTTINYELDNSGSSANITIYNANGQFVREIANGELLARQGFFRWDGLDDNGNLVTVGYYIVVFEIFDTNGNTDIIKQTVVVGTQL